MPELAFPEVLLRQSFPRPTSGIDSRCPSPGPPIVTRRVHRAPPAAALTPLRPGRYSDSRNRQLRGGHEGVLPSRRSDFPDGGDRPSPAASARSSHPGGFPGRSRQRAPQEPENCPLGFARLRLFTPDRADRGHPHRSRFQGSQLLPRGNHLGPGRPRIEPGKELPAHRGAPRRCPPRSASSTGARPRASSWTPTGSSTPAWPRSPRRCSTRP